LEDAIFGAVGDDAVQQLLERAVEIHGENLIADHIASACVGVLSIADCRAESTPLVRSTLADASQTTKHGWFKSVTWMEEVARDIIGPGLPNTSAEFRAVTDAIKAWVDAAA
jgi:hypothetical protein